MYIYKYKYQSIYQSIYIGRQLRIRRSVINAKLDELYRQSIGNDGGTTGGEKERQQPKIGRTWIIRHRRLDSWRWAVACCASVSGWRKNSLGKHIQYESRWGWMGNAKRKGASLCFSGLASSSPINKPVLAGGISFSHSRSSLCPSFLSPRMNDSLLPYL